MLSAPGWCAMMQASEAAMAASMASNTLATSCLAPSSTGPTAAAVSSGIGARLVVVLLVLRESLMPEHEGLGRLAASF